MKRVLLSSACAASLAAFSSGAMAQDAGNFSGFYFGGEAAFFRSHPVVGDPVVGTDLDTHGVAPGAYVGYDVQSGDAVFGVLADVDFIHAGAEAEYFGKFSLVGYEYGVDWVATARLRMGVAASDNLLLYGTGGLAFGQFDASSNGLSISGPFGSSDSGIRHGTAAGLGFEWALPNSWAFKGEFLHYRFDDLSVAGFGGPVNFSPELDVVKFGLAYRF